MEKNNTSNGFANGFFLGLLLGAAAVFLLGTKKGKKLLKALTEEGLEGISGLEEFFVTEEDNQKPFGKAQGKNGKSHLTVSEVVNTVENAVHNTEQKAVKVVAKIEKPVRRFFRGIPKRN